MVSAVGWQDDRLVVLKVSHWVYQLSLGVYKLADGLSESSVCSRVSFHPQGKDDVFARGLGGVAVWGNLIAAGVLSNQLCLLMCASRPLGFDIT